MLRSNAAMAAIFLVPPTLRANTNQKRFILTRRSLLWRSMARLELMQHGLHSSVNSVRYNADLWKLKLFEMPAWGIYKYGWCMCSISSSKSPCNPAYLALQNALSHADTHWLINKAACFLLESLCYHPIITQDLPFKLSNIQHNTCIICRYIWQ